jgi:hypothetical protein
MQDQFANGGSFEGDPVLRRPEALRMHPALEELVVIDDLCEFNEAAESKDEPDAAPLLITTDGIILAGFGRWRLAILKGEQEIACMEYPFSEDESLRFILKHHQPRRGWNPFTRIRVALRLEVRLQQKALDNMRTGGRYKGLANLPEAQHIDVREAIAQIAGVGARNVTAVKDHSSHRPPEPDKRLEGRPADD